MKSREKLEQFLQKKPRRNIIKVYPSLRIPYGSLVKTKMTWRGDSIYLRTEFPNINSVVGLFFPEHGGRIEEIQLLFDNGHKAYVSYIEFYDDLVIKLSSGNKKFKITIQDFIEANTWDGDIYFTGRIYDEITMKNQKIKDLVI